MGDESVVDLSAECLKEKEIRGFRNSDELNEVVVKFEGSRFKVDVSR